MTFTIHVCPECGAQRRNMRAEHPCAAPAMEVEVVSKALADAMADRLERMNLTIRARGYDDPWPHELTEYRQEVGV